MNRAKTKSNENDTETNCERYIEKRDRERENKW